MFDYIFAYDNGCAIATFRTDDRRLAATLVCQGERLLAVQLKGRVFATDYSDGCPF